MMFNPKELKNIIWSLQAVLLWYVVAVLNSMRQLAVERDLSSLSETQPCIPLSLSQVNLFLMYPKSCNSQN